MENAISTLYGIGAATIVAVVGFIIKILIGKWSSVTSKIIERVVEPVVKKIEADYIPEAIDYTNQTFVDDLRKMNIWKPRLDDGTFDVEKYKNNQHEAINTAYKSLIGSIPKKWRQTLEKIFPNVEVFLKTKIEAFIRNSKRADIKNENGESISPNVFS